MLELGNNPLANFLNINDVGAFTGEKFVDDRYAENSAQGFVESLPSLFRLHPPRLHPQQTGNGLQIIFYPMMDLLDHRILNPDLFTLTPSFSRIVERQNNAVPLFSYRQERHSPYPEPMKRRIGY